MNKKCAKIRYLDVFLSSFFKFGVEISTSENKKYTKRDAQV